MLRNIVVLNDHGYVSGGAAQVALSSLNGLAERGYRVIFFSGVAPLDDGIDKTKVEVVNLGHEELIRNPSRLEAVVSGLWNSHSRSALRGVLEALNPAESVIHLHTWTKSLSASVIKEALHHQFAIVCTLHDYFSVCPNGGLYHYSRQRPCGMKPMSVSCVATNCDSRSYGHKLWRVLRQSIQSRFGGMPDGVKNFIAVSEFSADKIHSFLPADSNIYNVSNPIEVGKNEAASPADNDTFTFVGRLSPEKGGELFARAAAKTGIKARFVGDGVSLPYVKKNLPDGEFWGWQERPEVVDAIQSSRALVFPSLWFETDGLVVKEAAALGVPTIVSDGCAAREHVLDGKTGLHFRSRDAEDLADKLMLLKEKDDLVSSFGKNGFVRYWEAPFTRERHLKELLDCYQDILAQSKS